MHSRVVQRVGRPGDAQEPRTLLERLGAEARHLLELIAAGKISVCLPVIGDGLGKGRADAAHILQEVRTGRIEGNAHGVDAAFHGVVQLLLEKGLVYIVLILPHSEGLGVYLDQFCQGIHETPADGNRAPHRNVVLGEFLTPHLGGGIDRRAVLAHGEHADTFRQSHLADEVLRLTAGRATADGNDLNAVLLYPIGHLGKGLHLFGHRRMRENDIVRQQIPLRVQAHHLAARPEARVNGHHAFLAHGRCQKQLPEVLPEHVDAFCIGLLLGLADDLSGDGRVQEALPGVVHGLPDLKAGLAGRRIPLRLTVVVIQLVAALLTIGVDVHLEVALVLRTQHGQQVVGGNFADGLAEAEVAAVLGGLGGLAAGLGHPGLHPAGAIDGAEGLAVCGRLADTLRDNVAGALQGFIGRCHLPLHEFAGLFLGMGDPPLPEKVCEGLKAAGRRDGRARFPFGPIGKVQVFQFARNHALLNLCAQLRREFALLIDGLQDGSLPLIHFLEDLCPVLDLGHLHVGEAAGAFLAVSADKRDGAAVGDELRAVFHLPGLNAKQFGYIYNV